MNIGAAEADAFWRQPGDIALEERVYRFLHDRIALGMAVPGSSIVGNRIAKHLGVSRITVTNALRRLSSEGFVVVHPHRGATVASLDLATLNEILRIRYALESEVIIELASSLDDSGLVRLTWLDDRVRQSLLQNDTQDYRRWEKRFHLAVYELSGLPMITSFLTDLWNRIEPYRGRRYTSQLLAQEAINDHRRILDALAERDAASAVAAMKAHIVRGHNHLLHVFIEESKPGDASLPATQEADPLVRFIPQQGPSPGSLLAGFATLPDPRRGQGRMYTQHGVLTLAVCAMLCGARSQYAIAAWIHDVAAVIRESVGWPAERIPSAPTVHRILSRVDPERFDQVLERWLTRHGFETETAGVRDRTSGVHGERPAGADIVESLANALNHSYTMAQQDHREGDADMHWSRLFGTVLYGDRLPHVTTPAEQHLWAEFLHVAGHAADLMDRADGT